ncbi:MAG: nucleoside hydrolase [Pseudomonadota bacterium]
MSAVWVDTDFGFDDLWALLLLQKIGCPVAGVSLVAGNTPLAQVAANAVGSKAAYGFDWPVWRGAARPLKRAQETAQRILGATGMRSRGVRLPDVETDPPPEGAVDAMGAWLAAHSDGKAELLSLGPLTNVAILLQRFPDAIDRLERIVWMGGSAGAGNHTSLAEFNALADPEALAVVLESEVPFDIVDLVFVAGSPLAQMTCRNWTR